VFQDIEFQLSLSDPVCWIEYVSFYYLKVMPPGRSFTARLDLTAGNFDQSAEALSDKLDALLNGVEFFEMQYRHTAPGSVATATDYIRARLTQVSGVDGTGEDQRSDREVTILEVPNTVPASTMIAAQPASLPSKITQSYDAGNGTAIVLTKPSGTLDGHLLITCIAWRVGATMTPPAGWTAASPPDDTTNATLVMQTWWKIASGEPATWTWTESVARRWASATFVYANLAAAPLSVSSETTGSTSATVTTTLPSVTTVAGNAQLTGFVAADANVTWVTPDNVVLPGGGVASTVSIAAIEAIQGVAGPSGDIVLTSSAAVANQVGQLIAWKSLGT
jgi:hypothetical protein